MDVVSESDMSTWSDISAVTSISESPKRLGEGEVHTEEEIDYVIKAITGEIENPRFEEFLSKYDMREVAQYLTKEQI